MIRLSKLTIGTRGSQMALAQANAVADGLKVRFPGLTVELKIIQTQGDINFAPIPLDSVGKEWFTKEIEQELLKGTIDLAVHSLKDLPPFAPHGLTVHSVLAREDPRDALLHRSKLRLADLPSGAVVGTDSLRRKALILQLRPDIRVESIRGNANTRLKKLEDRQYDALVMAAAGLKRIDETQYITEYFPLDTFVPAIGQGVLAAELRESDAEIRSVVKLLEDDETQEVVAAEQAFAQEVGSGCKLPVGCCVRFEGEQAVIHGMVGSMDCQTTVTKTVTGMRREATALARELAIEMARVSFVREYRDGDSGS